MTWPTSRPVIIHSAAQAACSPFSINWAVSLVFLPLDKSLQGLPGSIHLSLGLPHVAWDFSMNPDTKTKPRHVTLQKLACLESREANRDPKVIIVQSTLCIFTWFTMLTWHSIRVLDQDPNSTYRKAEICRDAFGHLLGLGLTLKRWADRIRPGFCPF